MTTRQAVNTTVGNLSWKGVVSTLVGAGIAFLVSHLTGYDLGKWAEISAFAVPAYFAGITYLEAKFPKFSWFFLLFPQKPAAPVNPTPAPVVPVTPVTPAAKSKAVKKPVVK